jgi:hypothetical protein
MAKKRAAEADAREEEGFVKVVTLDNCVVRVSETDEGYWTVQVWKGADKNPDGTGPANGKHAMPKSLEIDDAIRQAIDHT